MTASAWTEEVKIHLVPVGFLIDAEGPLVKKNVVGKITSSALAGR